MALSVPVQCRVLSSRHPQCIYLACMHTGAALQLEGQALPWPRTSLLKHFELIVVSATGLPGLRTRMMVAVCRQAESKGNLYLGVGVGENLYKHCAQSLMILLEIPHPIEIMGMVHLLPFFGLQRKQMVRPFMLG